MAAVNHWVALVVYKPAWDKLPTKKQQKIINQDQFKTKFYLMDSSNMQHLKESTRRLPDLINERVMEWVKLGLKASDKFTTQMRIQSLFDQRAMLAKLINCFNDDGTSNLISERLDFPNVCKLYTNCYLQNMLRTFYLETANKDEETKQEGILVLEAHD